MNLRLADTQEIRAAINASGCNGQHVDLAELGKDPLAVAQLQKAQERRQRIKGRALDHVYLTRYDGTSVVQWTGRTSGGYFVPIGEMMVPVA